eukprot:NODE_82_length_22625_cov_0.476516.p1 type:complete len:909 gc:universal NODE_82_length_22625_cov_0.476516:5472-8198(+)
MDFISQTPSVSSRETSTFSLFNTNRRARILRDYHSTDENEISVEQDDMVTILFMEEMKDITKTSKVLIEHHGRLGWIPCNYITMEEEETKTAPTPVETLKLAPITNNVPPPISITTNSINKKDKKKSVLNPGSPVIVKSPQKMEMPALPSKTWTDFMGREQIDNLKLTKTEIKRQECIYELLLTEQDYVRDLEMIIDVYIRPLRKSRILSIKDIGIIFGVWEQLVPVNSELLKKLDEKHIISPVIEEIGDIWSNITDYMKVYTMYCSNHPYALMRLEKVNNIKAFNKFAQQCQISPECRNLPLSSYLLKPVQRICKYPLLIREILKHTPKEHRDFENLQQGLLKVETLVTIVNDHAKQTETVQKMMKIQASFNNKIIIVSPARTLVTEKEVMQVVINNEDKTISRRSRILYIFNDMLIMGKEERLQMRNDDVVKMKVITSLQYDKLLVSQCAQGEYGHENCFVLSRKDGDDSYLIQCKNTEERNKLVKQFKGLISEHLKSYYRVQTPVKQIIVDKPVNMKRKSLLDEVQIPEVDNLFIFEEHLQDMYEDSKDEIENEIIDDIVTSSEEEEIEQVDIAAKMLAQHTALTEQIAFEISQHSLESNRNSRFFKTDKFDALSEDKTDTTSSKESISTSMQSDLHKEEKIPISEIKENETLPISQLETMDDSDKENQANSVIQERMKQLNRSSLEVKDPRTLTIKRMANSGNVANMKTRLSADTFTPPEKKAPIVPPKPDSPKVETPKEPINEKIPPPIPQKHQHKMEESPTHKQAPPVPAKHEQVAPLVPVKRIDIKAQERPQTSVEIKSTPTSPAEIKSIPVEQSSINATANTNANLDHSSNPLPPLPNKRPSTEVAPDSKPLEMDQQIELMSLKVVQNRQLPQMSKPAKSARIAGVFKAEEGKREYVIFY